MFVAAVVATAVGRFVEQRGAWRVDVAVALVAVVAAFVAVAAALGMMLN